VTDVLLRDAALGDQRVDVEIAAGRVVALAPARSISRRAASVIDAAGGALLPGLHDHHIHLMALAAARASVPAGPPEVGSPDQLVATLRAADRALPPGAWIRAVGYHDSVAGPIDRNWLDAAVARRPVRVQHRSGRAWILNSAATALTDLNGAALSGIERDADGTVTGRLYGADDWLRQRVPPVSLDVAGVGSELAAYGVTAVTDATPIARADELLVLTGAVCSPDFPVGVVVTGAATLPPGLDVAVVRGPVKIVVADHDLPPLDFVVDAMREARRQRRGVAVHCVTREALLLTMAAWDEVGARPGDRIEHGAVIPLELVPRLLDLGVTVVTQPGFVRDRGDAYLADVEGADIGDLWRCGSLLAAGIPVAGGSDAPYGPADPWLSVTAAVTRRTAGGQVLGRAERIPAQAALDLFLGPLDAPGGAPRAVSVGVAADLCILDGPLARALEHPARDRVVATIAGGRVTHQR
jgi:predicted amidohydrolase YtcJ